MVIRTSNISGSLGLNISWLSRKNGPIFCVEVFSHNIYFEHLGAVFLKEIKEEAMVEDGNKSCLLKTQ